MGRFPRFCARTSCFPSSCIYKSRKYSLGVGRTREWIQATWESCVLCYFASWAALACKSGSVAQIALSGLSVAPCQMEGGLGRCFGLGFLLGFSFWQNPPLSWLCPGVAPLRRPPPKPFHSQLRRFSIFLPDAPNFFSKLANSMHKTQYMIRLWRKVWADELTGTSLTIKVKPSSENKHTG